ncbi:MAG: hypothetical protein AAGA48_19370 [Myxococcota bacterium]
MTLPVVVHADAEDEITEAAIWYEARRPGFGLEFVAAIDRSVLEIGENPSSSKHGTHLGDASFFRLPLRDLLRDRAGSRRRDGGRSRQETSRLLGDTPASTGSVTTALVAPMTIQYVKRDVHPGASESLS